MMKRMFQMRLAVLAAFGYVFAGVPWAASAETIVRVAAYNIEADTGGYTTPRPGLYQVLEGIGEEVVQGNVQPLDILALEETTSNATTVAPIVSNLNSYYSGAAVYAQSPVQGGQNGSPSSGNGPNALIYNTNTLTLLNSVPVGTPGGSGNGEYRQVMRYEFQPVGGSAANDFYVYVTHMKADSGYTDESYRSEEAAIIRANEAALPASASVLYVGDFNLDGSALVTKSGSPSVSAYQTMTASGQGQAVDPLNVPQNNNITWSGAPAFASLFTESATKLEYRDDLELMTQNVYSGTSSALDYVAGSLHAFGNNGSVGLDGSVNSLSNTALNDLEANAPISASTLLSDLTQASDHVPVVADYDLVGVPEPSSLVLLLAGAAGLALAWKRRNETSQGK
jgi:endonuclease/exonuclease/phosphatase family metal-dependent hydrolase